VLNWLYQVLIRNSYIYIYIYIYINDVVNNKTSESDRTGYSSARACMLSAVMRAVDMRVVCLCIPVRTDLSRVVSDTRIECFDDRSTGSISLPICII